MIVYVHNEDKNQIEKYNLSLDDNMPYTSKHRLTVRSFLAGNDTEIMWTTKRFLKSIEKSFSPCRTIDIRCGFKRGWQEVENGQYMHKAGTAIQGAEKISYLSRVKLMKRMEERGLFDWMNELDHGPSYLHFSQDASFESPLVPFKTIKKGDIGTVVFVLQDNLWKLGYSVCQCNGEFDEELEKAVKAFQKDQGLLETGIVGPESWVKLMRLIHPEDERLYALVD